MRTAENMMVGEFGAAPISSSRARPGDEGGFESAHTPALFHVALCNVSLRNGDA